MSLNFQLNGIENWEDVTKVTATVDDPGRGIKAGDRIMNPVTHCLIFGTMFLDCPLRDEKDAKEFFIRARIFTGLFGDWGFNRGEADDYKPMIPTREEIRAHIGLATNVGLKPRKKWLAEKVDSFERDLTREWERD